MVNSQGEGGLPFFRRINDARRIVADQNNGEPGRAPMFRFEPTYSVRNFTVYGFDDGFGEKMKHFFTLFHSNGSVNISTLGP